MMKPALALLALLLPLVACGRVGPPNAPGPRERIVYPGAYPQIPATARAGTAPAAVSVVPSVPLPVPSR